MSYLYKYFACLYVCLYSIRLCLINVKTAKLIGPAFFVWTRLTPGKVYGWSNFFYNVNKEKMFTIKMEDWNLFKNIFCFISPIFFNLHFPVLYLKQPYLFSKGPMVIINSAHKIASTGIFCIFGFIFYTLILNLVLGGVALYMSPSIELIVIFIIALP